jgi:four helix bundle protein
MPAHHTLKAWRHAQRLAVECVKAARRFPEHEQTALADRLRRAGYAVPLSLADGISRREARDAQPLLDAAWGALAAVQTLLAIARDVGCLQPAEFGRLEALAVETSKTLFGLLRRARRAADPPAGVR